jgi:hypothetical protein
MAIIPHIAVGSYPYFLGCIILLLVFCCLFLLFPGQRRAMWLSAALSTPFSLATLFLVPHYWMPRRLGDLLVGVEDCIFSFATGGIAWVLAVLFMEGRIHLPREIKPSWVRYLACIVTGGWLIVVCRFLGLGFMMSTLLSIYGVGLFLFISQRRLWFLALGGGFSFLLLYAAIFLVCLYFYPHFLKQWNPGAILALIWGVPLQELAWALGFGITWPLYMAFVFNVQVREQRGVPARPPGQGARF